LSENQSDHRLDRSSGTLPCSYYRVIALVTAKDSSWTAASEMPKNR